MAKFGALGCVALLLIGLLIGGLMAFTTYNKLVTLEEGVETAWSQVENQYQRRYDLIPNLVRTVEGAADFEKETLQNVIEARSRVGQVGTGGGPGGFNPTANPQDMSQFQAAQESLGGALSRLLVVVERYPELKANQNFLTLQSQLEGTENRIAVERMRYNEAAQQYNVAVRRFPGNIFAGIFGFERKTLFEATEGAQNAPEVDFDFSD